MNRFKRKYGFLPLDKSISAYKQYILWGNKNKNDVLYYAIELGYNDIVINYFNKYMSKAKKSDKRYKKSLYTASRHNNLEIVRYVYEILFDSNNQENKTLQQALQIALQNDNIEIVNYYLEKGVIYDRHILYHIKNTEVIDLIIDKYHFDVNIAIFNVNPTMGIYILNKYEISIVNLNSLLERFSTHNNNTNIIKLLIEKGANVHYDNDITLLYSALYTNIKTLNLLLENGANIDILKIVNYFKPSDKVIVDLQVKKFKKKEENKGEKKENTNTESKKCKAKTKSGANCKNTVKDGDYCHLHKKEE